MPKIIPIKDLKNTTLISSMYMRKQRTYLYNKKMARLDVYEKLALAENEVRGGKMLDADESLELLREKYNV